MKTRSALSPGLIGIVAALACVPQMSAQQIPGKFPGGCAEPPKRPSEIGCYLSAIQPVATLPDEPIFWHLYTYPTRAAAEAAKAKSLSTVADSLDKVWLFTLANANWQPSTGERVAVIGRLPFHAEENTWRATWKLPSRQIKEWSRPFTGILDPRLGTY